MIARRGSALIVVATVTATACGSGDGAPEPVPTVPAAGVSSTAPTATDPPAAVEDDVATTGPSSTVAPPPEPAVAASGDLQNVRVTFEELVVVEEPIAMTTVPGSGYLWIAGRQGQVFRVDPSTGELIDVALDLRADAVGRGEMGLLGIAADDGHLYVNFTDPAGDTHVDSFALTADGVDIESRRQLLFQHQPFRNHNGGGLVVDSVGRLYIAFGDGGSSGDPLGAGQDPGTWLGSILRIEPTPEADAPYSIPPDNPFATGGGLPEIYLIGVRNPWRFSFDSATGDLWVADVGQNTFEEVTLLPAAAGAGLGANLGWSLREGLHEFSGAEPDGHVAPIYEYDHSAGRSVTGGYVYRGAAIPDLFGHYVFGDYVTSRLWGLGISTDEVIFRDLEAPVPGGSLVSFGAGPDGELYTLSLDGLISRIVAA